VTADADDHQHHDREDPMTLFNLYADPDGQDYLGTIGGETAAEAEAKGSAMFGGPVIAVAPGDPPPNRRPFSPPFVLDESAP
jgi:hypothetical protein